MVELDKQMISLFKSDEWSGCNILSDFFRFLHWLESMPLLQLHKVLSGQYRFAFPGHPGI